MCFKGALAFLLLLLMLSRLSPVFAAPTLTLRLEAAGTTSATAVTGRAPLMVFFDATDSTDPSTTKPIHHLTYCFDADKDTANAEFYTRAGHKAIPKSEYCGPPLWAYVYQTPGTYTARVQACNAAGECVSSEPTITVTDYNHATETICVDANTTPVAGADGCPAGSAVAQQANFKTAYDNAIAAGRINMLFRQGDSFASGSSAITISSSANGGAIRAYGPSGLSAGRFNVTGAPTVNCGPGNPCVFFFSSGAARVVDFRILDGTFGSAAVNFSDLQGNNDAWDRDDDPIAILFQNWDVSATASAGRFSGSLQYGSDFPYWIGYFSMNFQDCSNGGGGNNCLFPAVHGLAIYDSHFANSEDGEHVIRCQHCEWLTMVGNKLEETSNDDNSGNFKHLLTVRACDWDCPGFCGVNRTTPGVGCQRYTERLFITDNWLVNNTQLANEVCAPNGADPVRCQDIIFERNYHTQALSFLGNPFAQTAYQLGTGGAINGPGQAQNYTVRAELYDGRNGRDFYEAGRFGATGTEVYNNSMYGGNAQMKFWNGGDSSVVFTNNVAWSIGTFYNSGATPPSVATNNWGPVGNAGEGTNQLSAAPFVTIPPTGVDSYQIAAGHPDNLETIGTAVNGRCDYGQTDLLVASNLPIGAWRAGTDTNICTSAGSIPPMEPPDAPQVIDGILVQ